MLCLSMTGVEVNPLTSLDHRFGQPDHSSSEGMLSNVAVT